MRWFGPRGGLRVTIQQRSVSHRPCNPKGGASLQISLLVYSVLAFVDTYPTVCSYLFRRISLSRDHPRFFSLALSLFVEEAFWPRYARIQHSRSLIWPLRGRCQREVPRARRASSDPNRGRLFRRESGSPLRGQPTEGFDVVRGTGKPWVTRRA
jgi:hypothetical protein